MSRQLGGLWAGVSHDPCRALRAGCQVRIWSVLEEAQRSEVGSGRKGCDHLCSCRSENAPSALLPTPNGRDWERSSFSFPVTAQSQGCGSG